MVEASQEMAASIEINMEENDDQKKVGEKKKNEKSDSGAQEFVDQADKLPPDLNPFASATSHQATIDEGYKAPSFRRQERELFEMAMVLEGAVQKKTTGFITRWQTKYFKVIAAGAYLAYYDNKPDPSAEKPDVPNGVICIRLLRETENSDGTITKNIFFNEKKPKEFSFNYGDRMFECRVNSAMEGQLWVLSLEFLSRHAGDIIQFDDRKPLKYFTNYKDVVKFRGKQYEKDDKYSSNSEDDDEVQKDLEEAIIDNALTGVAAIVNTVESLQAVG